MQSLFKQQLNSGRARSALLIIGLAVMLKLTLASFVWIYLRALLPVLAAFCLAKILIVPLVVLFIMNNLKTQPKIATKQEQITDKTILLDPIMDDDVDLVQNPHPLFEKYRALGNIAWSSRGNQWIVTGFDEANQILRNNNFGKKLERWKHPNPVSRWLFRLLRAINGTNMLFQDPPEHTRVRSLMQSAFIPSTVRKLEPKIQQTTDTLLGGIAPGEEGDMLAQFAFPLPVIVIAELLGIPSADRDQFKEWSTQIVSSLRGNVCPYRAIKSFQASRELRAYLRKVVKNTASKPDDDLLTALVKVQSEDGSRLSKAELLSNSILLLIAGHETTVNLIGNGMYQLLTNPSQKELLLKYPSLIDSAVEEVLRFDPPVQMVRRLANKDTLVGSQSIKKGEVVTILIGACNRDPIKFKNPSQFDIQREPVKHLSFGGGIHYCLGAELARTEARIAIQALLEKYPAIKLQKEKPTYKSPFALRGFKELGVTYLFLFLIVGPKYFL